jgi:uncharacterized protein (UPF0333 family)
MQKKQNSKAQAILEYLIVVSMIVAISLILIPVLKKNIRQLWAFMAKNIAAPCPGCQVDPSLQL